MARKKKWSARHVFTPTRENGNWPHSLAGMSVAIALLVTVSVEIGFLALTGGLGSISMTASVLPSVVTSLTNDARVQNHIAGLVTNPLLAKAAQGKADDMAAKGYFSHVAPDGTQPWTWFKKVGYDYRYAGENLAIDFTDSDQVVKAWLASPTHRANIMKPSYTEIGIGMATGTYQGRQTLFVVQFFGAPKNPNASAPTATASNGSSTGRVLGAQTSVPLSFVEKVKASPYTYATYALTALLSIFALLEVLAFMPYPRTWPHPNAIVNGLGLIAVALALIIFNQHALVAVQLPAEGAAAITALGY